MITVRKATKADIAKLKNNPTWGCEVSEFDWHYDSEEICWLTEGEVTVTYDGGSVSFGAGDYVEFPKGLSCVWKVTKPVKKHYEFPYQLKVENTIEAFDEEEDATVFASTLTRRTLDEARNKTE